MKSVRVSVCHSVNFVFDSVWVTRNNSVWDSLYNSVSHSVRNSVWDSISMVET